MVSIKLEHISKKFSGSWIFRDLNVEFNQPSNWVVLGANGSGKSTLLLLLSGYIAPHSGSITWSLDSKPIPAEEVPKLMAYCTPQLQLDEHLTVHEQIEFYFRFKPIINTESIATVLDFAQLQNHKHKSVNQLSSGLQQRLKLSLALCSNTPVLCLDEPTNHLDKAGIMWYTEALQRFSKNRLVIVASNHNSNEYDSMSNAVQL